jgi:hypothetical protein
MSKGFDFFYYIIEQIFMYDKYQEKGLKMKKIVSMTLVSAVSTMLLVGCNAKSGAVAPEDSFSGGYEMSLPANVKDAKIESAIKQAGEENGWIMTKFKTNSFIAEKIDGDKSASATISFDDNKLVIMEEESTLSSLDSDIDKLQDSILEILKHNELH